MTNSSIVALVNKETVRDVRTAAAADWASTRPLKTWEGRGNKRKQKLPNLLKLEVVETTTLGFSRRMRCCRCATAHRAGQSSGSSSAHSSPVCHVSVQHGGQALKRGARESTSARPRTAPSSATDPGTA